MSGDDTPITKGMVGIVAAAVSAALVLAAFVYTMRADVDRLEADARRIEADLDKLEAESIKRSDLDALRGEVGTVRALLCDHPENRDRYECRKDVR